MKYFTFSYALDLIDTIWRNCSFGMCSSKYVQVERVEASDFLIYKYELSISVNVFSLCDGLVTYPRFPRPQLP